jgi:nucleoside-diphosphate-sugar epimerase
MIRERETILITGSSGLIGRKLVEQFAPDYNVVAFDIVEPKQLPDGATFVKLDLSSQESVDTAMKQARATTPGGRIASVLHLAAYYDFAGEPSDKYEQITVRGTERLIRALRRPGSFTVEQLVFSSTMLVHAPCKIGERIDEDWPIQPKWDYPKSKVETEELLRRERGSIPIVLLRIAGVYDDECHSIPLSNQIKRIHEGQMTAKVFPGDTATGQAMVHLDDLIDAFVRTVERRERLPQETVLLIGEPETVSYDELQRRFSNLIHGEEWETKQIPKAIAKTGAWIQDKMPSGEESFIKPWMIDLADDHYELDIARARELLGWEPEHSLHETLPTMIERMRENPGRWYKQHNLEPPKELGAQQKAR